MTHAELLRKHAVDATNEGGIWFSGEYMTAVADAAEGLEAENAKLRELVRDMYKAFMHGNCYRWCEFKEPCNYISDGRCQWYDRMRSHGIEVAE